MSGTDHLRKAVQLHLAGADEDAVEVVVALTGLIAAVAYADRTITEHERAHMQQAIAQVRGLSAAGVEAVCAVLREHVIDLASINTQAFTRALRDRLDVDARREVLDVLVDLAAADGEIVLAESDLLRRTTSALGLEHDDYLASQSRHRDKLKVLRQ